MVDLLNEYPAVLRISEVAEILNINQATVRRHIRNNDIPSIKVGRLVRIPKDSLISYLHGYQSYKDDHHE
ncbi:MAG: helix-turn-helix domain-containing protein [Lachnospiraceae bacterium]|nr:helix-turn-helix domain-containing protein [Lachnospiraceae bacterium]